MRNIIHMLYQGEYSCVIANKEIRVFTKPGVADLYNLYCNEIDFLKGASIADKIVGKAAAALMIKGEIKEVYTPIISLSALMLLREADIEVGFERVVPFIHNRDQTDWCPLEQICYKEESAENIFLLIQEFIRKQRSMHLKA